MQLLAISVDEPAASRSFRGNYGINFPLLSDRGGAVSRAYVGLNDADISVPGVVVIRRSGEVVFRQVATGADDRLTAAQLLAAIDRSLGTTGAAAERGYVALERWQLRLAGGAGAARSDRQGQGDAWSFRPSVELAGFVPLHRFALAGLQLRTDSSEPLQAGLAVGLRLPILADAGAIQLIADGGVALLDDVHPQAGARLGAWVALNPRWALTLEGGGRLHDLTGDQRLPELFAAFGIARLIER